MPANLASRWLGGPIGKARRVHPNDGVNRGQSCNDVGPTAMHVAAVIALERALRPGVGRLRVTLAASLTTIAIDVRWPASELRSGLAGASGAFEPRARTARARPGTRPR